MKKALHCLLILTGLFFATRISAQELVYEQDHGLSFNKGTINTDVLIQLIQEKQEELNKFVLQRMVTKTWLESSGTEDSKLDNFTTKYLIYKTMNELTVTADKSKFGKNTLELLKEASIVFGIAYSIKRDFLIRPVLQEIGNKSTVEESQIRDVHDFSQQLDMVLNACLENPKMIGYFPLYGRLMNPEDPDRHWYLNDNRYLQNQDSLAAAYQSIVIDVNKIAGLLADIQQFKKNVVRLEAGTIDSVQMISKQLVDQLKAGQVIDTNAVWRLKDSLQVIINCVPTSFLDLLPKLNEAKIKVEDLLKGFNDEKIKQLNELIVFMHDLNAAIDRVRKGDYSPLLRAFASEIRQYVVSSSNIGNQQILGFDEHLKESRTFIKSIKEVYKDDPYFVQLDTLVDHVSRSSWMDLTAEVGKLSYDFENWKLENDQTLTYRRANQLLSRLLNLKRVTRFCPKYIRLKRKINKNCDNNGFIDKNQVNKLLNKKGFKKEKWVKRLSIAGITTEFNELPTDSGIIVRLTAIIDTLKGLDQRYQITQQMFSVLAQSKSEQGLKGFFFDEQQLNASKELINHLIDHLDKGGGRFNVVAVYLKSLVNNVNYRQADSLERQPATISLNFESVLFSLNDQLVKPSRLYRSRYLQPFIHIGVNYAAFARENQLKVNEDGTTGNLNSLSFASEKIGLKIKIANQKYTRSFGPGMNYKYYNLCGETRVWNRPQPKTAIDDYFIDVYAGGLLYNAVNLKSDKNFDFPFAGVGLGVRTFNGLTFSGSYNVPFTNGLTEAGAWKQNAFWMFSIDIPIIEYISALRKK